MTSAGIDRLHSFTSSIEPAAVLPDVDVESLAKKHQEYTDIWEASSIFAEYQEFFSSIIAPLRMFKVDQAMVLGMGSLSSINYSGEETVGRAMMELVCFESCVKYLGKREPIRPIYFQDPVFTDVDRAFLQSRGYQVVDSPASDSLLTSTTFVWGWGEQMVLDSSLVSVFPPLLIGDDMLALNSFHQNPYRSAEELEAAPVMDQEMMLPMVARSTPLRREFCRARMIKALPYLYDAFSAASPTEPPQTTWIYYQPDSPSDIGELELTGFGRIDDAKLFTVRAANLHWDKWALRTGAVMMPSASSSSYVRWARVKQAIEAEAQQGLPDVE